jgi:hypothetical protein
LEITIPLPNEVAREPPIKRALWLVWHPIKDAEVTVTLGLAIVEASFGAAEGVTEKLTNDDGEVLGIWLGDKLGVTRVGAWDGTSLRSLDELGRLLGVVPPPGDTLGTLLGVVSGERLGEAPGDAVGIKLGALTALGFVLGLRMLLGEALALGDNDGWTDGRLVGPLLGPADGIIVGIRLGWLDGASDGKPEGFLEGASDGILVGESDGVGVGNGVG